MKLTLSILIALLALLFALCFAFGAPYQTYKQEKCWWCGRSNVRLVVHHVQPQHLHPELANDHPENYVTLCDPMLSRSSGCYFIVGHKRNWTNEVTELQILLGKGQEK